MSLQELQPGDIVYAATDILSDGDIPNMNEGDTVASAGTMGVIINTGHLEEQPDKEIYLVRFEDANKELGPAVGCWPEELSEHQAPYAMKGK
jgi:nitrogen fixation protein NifZ